MPRPRPTWATCRTEFVGLCNGKAQFDPPVAWLAGVRVFAIESGLLLGIYAEIEPSFSVMICAGDELVLDQDGLTIEGSSGWFFAEGWAGLQLVKEHAGMSALRQRLVDSLAEHSDLSRVWTAYADASERLSHYCRNGNPITEEGLDARQAACDRAEQTFLDHMLNEHGLTKRQVERLVV